MPLQLWEGVRYFQNPIVSTGIFSSSLHFSLTQVRGVGVGEGFRWALRLIGICSARFLTCIISSGWGWNRKWKRGSTGGNLSTVGFSTWLLRKRANNNEQGCDNHRSASQVIKSEKWELCRAEKTVIIKSLWTHTNAKNASPFPLSIKSC